MVGSTATGGWRKRSRVKIEIPTGVEPSRNSHPYDIPGLRRRPLVEVIKEACTDESARDFHFEPFRAYRPRPTPQGDTAI